STAHVKPRGERLVSIDTIVQWICVRADAPIYRRKIVSRLRRQNHSAVPLSPGLQALLDVRPQGRMLNKTPRFVHDAELQCGLLLRILHTCRDAMQYIEQQRLQKCGEG